MGVGGESGGKGEGRKEEEMRRMDQGRKDIGRGYLEIRKE